MPEQDGRKARKAEPGPERRPARAKARKAEPEPVPEPAVMAYASLNPDDAAAAVLASGHGVGGHPGLGAGASN